ncbi:lysozyme inhibitor LprI family protein [Bacillus sp. V59.32b]|uniref:lysozyme inhibitor LprI family protein n=1 Tax=Bacillus sp. V59.32b TaxID=1758642 RepID=UPI0020B15E92|nr:lysozyme inhibitor LprI family protein [Bacillus sp. V59.32b]
MKKLIVMPLFLSLFLVGCGTSANDQAAEEEKPVSENDTDSNQDTKTDSQNIKSNEDTKTDSQSTENKKETKADSQSMESKKNNTESPNTKNNEETNASKKNTSSPVLGEKAKYIIKLNEIKKSLGEFDKVLETGTQVEMGQAYGEIFTRWDNALNDIYGTLEKQLSANEMDRLREEQREWIIYRDETAQKESLKFEGGTMESLEYISIQARITEERCYDLVEGHMN